MISNMLSLRLPVLAALLLEVSSFSVSPLLSGRALPAQRACASRGLKRVNAMRSPPVSRNLVMKGNEVVIEPDYKVAAGFLAAGAALFALKAPAAGVPIGALGVLFAVQTGRVRFVLDDEAFELKVKGQSEQQLDDSGENIVVGGANRWKYPTWVNYDFFPSLEFPILVYFKENQTPQEKWGKGPGGFDNRNNGQIHFFPAICNTEQLNKVFIEKGLPSERYNPK
mmetsp:Transcript_8863/g.29608  ORF Transcript_8863/g.29608 Transcript_8863/m.29608 type:complete len:225 (-) Transcript_8863:97-771(-)